MTLEYPDFVTCPRCGRENVKINHGKEQMVTHVVPTGFVDPEVISDAVDAAEALKDSSGHPVAIFPTTNKRPGCKASKRRPENALIPGSLRGRGDLRLKR